VSLTGQAEINLKLAVANAVIYGCICRFLYDDVFLERMQHYHVVENSEKMIGVSALSSADMSVTLCAVVLTKH